MPGNLLAIGDRRRTADGDLVAWARQLAAAEVPAVQLREKDLSDLELFHLACRMRRAFPQPGRLLVNGRLDLALASRADGIHLPASGLPADRVRLAAPESLLVGCSTHNLSEVRAAQRAGAHYATFGPVFATPGKEAREPHGLTGLARAAQEGLPLVALGGITTLDQVRRVAAAGARGVAGIRLFLDGPALVELVAAARSCFGGST